MSYTYSCQVEGTNVRQVEIHSRIRLSDEELEKLAIDEFIDQFGAYDDTEVIETECINEDEEEG
jgi:hypothetical protein